MKFILLLIFLIPQAMAQKSIGQETFMVNVRPVLSGIIGDFYQMISLFPDFPRDLVPLIEVLESLGTDKDNLRTTCPRRLEIKCKEQLENLRTKLKKMKGLSLALQIKKPISESLHLSTLAGLRVITEFNVELEDISGELDNSSFLFTAGISHKKETFTLLKKLDELRILLSLSVVEFIPYTYKEDFRHFFFNFINPLQQHLSKTSNFEFVNREISNLNFTLNLLNMTLTKKKKTPEGMAPYLYTIHNRWNSILRFYF